MVRDGEMAARGLRAAGARRRRLGQGTSASCRRWLRQAILAARNYGPTPSWRAEGLAFNRHGAAVAGARRPRPARTISLPTCGRSPPWRRRRKTWSSWPGCLTATVQPSTGLAVDTDLRWSLLRRPGQPGRAGRGRHRRRSCQGDATDAGERAGRRVAGRRCRRSRPSARTWGDADRRESWTIAMFRATIIGFGRPRTSRSSSQPYRPEYFRRAQQGVERVVLGDGTGLRGVRLPDRRGGRGDESRATDAYLATEARARPPRSGGCSSRAATRVARALRNQSPRNREAAIHQPWNGRRLGGSARDRLGYGLAYVLWPGRQAGQRPSRRWPAR